MTVTLFCWDCRRSQTFLDRGVVRTARDTPSGVNEMINVRCEACASRLGYIGEVRSADVRNHSDIEEEGERRVQSKLGGTVAITGNPPWEEPRGSLYMDAKEAIKDIGTGRAVTSIDDGRMGVPYDDFCKLVNIEVPGGIVHAHRGQAHEWRSL